MPNEEVPERVGKKVQDRVAELEKRLTELERTATALVKAMKACEDDNGECYMPIGEYFGERFDD